MLPLPAPRRKLTCKETAGRKGREGCAMRWRHSPAISVAEAGTAVVVCGDDGWEAFPFGLENGSSGVWPSREQAIEMVESTAGDVACCVGHLAEDSDSG